MLAEWSWEHSYGIYVSINIVMLINFLLLQLFQFLIKLNTSLMWIFTFVCVLAHVPAYVDKCLCIQMGATVGVCARVEGVCMCVNTVCTLKKELGWIRSCTCGNTFSRNSFHEIHNEAGLSSDVAPLLASHRLQLVCVCVRPCARARLNELRRSRSISPFFPLFTSSFKKIPPKPLTGCGELRTGPRVLGE